MTAIKIKMVSPKIFNIKMNFNSYLKNFNYISNIKNLGISKNSK